ncbi:MAG: protease pro-enzyme activation domain-containing protein [Bryobacteraceae bacterium]
MPLTKCYKRFRFSPVLTLLLAFATGSPAAPPDRITQPVDGRATRTIPGNLQPLAQPQFDRGAVDPGMQMNDMVLLVKPSPAQQAELDSLLVDQQNPSSAQFHKWLTPEQFGDRFGLSAADNSKVVAWLQAAGFTINRLARARNWIAFSGAAGQVSHALHTSFHSFQVNGETHFANTSAPSVPAALADVVGGFLGLSDFRLKPFVNILPAALSVGPEYTSGSSHFLAPQDFATIYDVTPLYQAGIDGTGLSIAVVGQSDVSLTDIEAFRSRYALPANDPQLILTGPDPGFNGAEVEGELDLEWSGAIAPNATIYYVYESNALDAILNAIDLNIAPIISNSYGACEVDAAASFFRSFAQQGNAQGITLISASGDSGAAGCDPQGYQPFATEGQMVDFPAVMPEVTGVGGTMFVEGNNVSTYWSSTNSTTYGSALSYIPETTWNESGSDGLLASGGGASLFYDKPAWQSGPGVPNDNVRDVPDVALSAAGHDAYLIYSEGYDFEVYGTSCGAPTMSGMVALLNHYLLSKGFLSQPGLGNINPQLYRLAQSAGSAFHDVTSGNNVVPCAQGSPNCLTGSFGYQAGTGYDTATGLGSIDANKLAMAWNAATNGVIVTLSAQTITGNVNASVSLTATVAPASGKGTPTGTVDFSINGTPLGSVALVSSAGQQTATVNFPLYLAGVGAALSAVYSGDAAFSSGGATIAVQPTTNPGQAAIVPYGPPDVWPSPPDAQGLSWQTTITLQEVAGTPAMVTGFTIDGQAQTLSQYFPSPSIPANGYVTATIVFRDLTTPVTRTFGFSGVDPTGQTWSRQIAVVYMPPPPEENFTLSATPLVVTQNTAADPSCQWSVQLNLDDLGGFYNLLYGLFVGGINQSSQIPAIFGTTRFGAYASLQGTLCFSGITPPATDVIAVELYSGYSEDVTVAFAGPPANPATISPSPAAINLSASNGAQTASATLTVNLSDNSQPWTASIFPANRTTGWLSASQLSGTGTGQIVLTASRAGFEPGVYQATIVIQSQNAAPQSISVPVMFVMGASTSGTSISGVANAASFQTTVSPGMLLSVFGTQLANSPQVVSTLPLPYSAAGVSVTVNGLAAPLLYISPTQLNIQVPYEVGAGPAVLGVNNNGQIAGFQFQIAPSAPGIFADAKGNLAPTSSATQPQGAITTLYLTGAGEVSPQIFTSFAPPSGTGVSYLPVPLLPLSVTVGGVPAFVYFAGIPPSLVGTTQVNFQVPETAPLGVQPLVVTVNGVQSKAVNLTVTAPVPAALR